MCCNRDAGTPPTPFHDVSLPRRIKPAQGLLVRTTTTRLLLRVRMYSCFFPGSFSPVPTILATKNNSSLTASSTEQPWGEANKSGFASANGLTRLYDRLSLVRTFRCAVLNQRCCPAFLLLEVGCLTHVCRTSGQKYRPDYSVSTLFCLLSSQFTNTPVKR